MSDECHPVRIFISILIDPIPERNIRTRDIIRNMFRVNKKMITTAVLRTECSQTLRETNGLSHYRKQLIESKLPNLRMRFSSFQSGVRIVRKIPSSLKYRF